MARPHIEPFVDRDVPFKKMTLPGFPKGMQYKMLSLDNETGACTMTVLFEPGYKQPPGMSYSEYELFIQSGSIQVGDKVHGPGSYFFVPAGVAIEALTSSRGATGLLFFNYGEPSFVESDSDHPRAEKHLFKTVNAYNDLQWSSTNFYPATAPGCFVKILRYEPRSQAFTFLYCMTPNFWQDNISYHDCMEEAYHIWGTSWMMQFGELPTGGYFWRPPYINHGSFRCKYGTIAFGRTDSVLFNYFHFNPWTNPDENKLRAAANLYRKRPALYQWVNSDGHNHPHGPPDFENPDYHNDTQVRLLHDKPVGGHVGKKRRK